MNQKVISNQRFDLIYTQKKELKEQYVKKEFYILDKTTSSSYRKNKGLFLIQFIIVSLQDIIPLSALIY